MCVCVWNEENRFTVIAVAIIIIAAGSAVGIAITEEVPVSHHIGDEFAYAVIAAVAVGVFVG